MTSALSDTELLPLVCFCVLMETRDGIIDTAPSYVSEKWTTMSRDPFMAFNMLDDEKQAAVIAYGERWERDFERLIKEMREDYYGIPASEWREKYSLNGLLGAKQS